MLQRFRSFIAFCIRDNNTLQRWCLSIPCDFNIVTALQIQASSQDGYPFFVISIMFTSNRRPSKTIPIHSYLFLIHRGIPFLCVAFIPKHEQHVKPSTNSENINWCIMQITEVVIKWGNPFYLRSLTVPRVSEPYLAKSMCWK